MLRFPEKLHFPEGMIHIFFCEEDVPLYGCWPMPSSNAWPQRTHRLYNGFAAHFAGVAELADAQDLGSCGVTPVEVQILSPAPCLPDSP